MARGGINKALVQKARLAVLARGEHPSIDAVRVQLGNTGSKTTIHRYLKELEAQHGPHSAQPRTLSDELGTFVQHLAERLQEEAQQAVAEERAALARERQDYQQQVRAAQARAEQATARVQALEQQLSEAQGQITLLVEQKHQGEVASARLRQAAGDLETRLRERDGQIASLEDKHAHARLALEHFRQAAKEQREQEARQHEGQLQQLGAEVRQLQQGLIVRQDEITQLHRDNARLLTEARQLRLTGEAHEQQHYRQALAIEVIRQDKARLEGQYSALEQQNQALSAELLALQQQALQEALELQTRHEENP